MNSPQRLFREPPLTPPEPVVEVLHGTEIIDPYRWLEEQDSSRTRQWLDEQARYCRSYFENLPERPTIKRRVSELLSDDHTSAPWAAGGCLFFERRTREEQQAVIVMRDQSGQESILVDPATRGLGDAASIALAGISPNGRFLAYGVRIGGTDHSAIELYDVEHRARMEDRVPDGYCYGFAFAGDDSGFYYSYQPLSPPNHNCVLFHRFGHASSNDTKLFQHPDPKATVNLIYSRKARLLLYMVTLTGKERSTSMYIQEEGGLPATLLIPELKARIVPFFVEDHLFAFTDFEAPNGRIVAINPIHRHPQSWQDVVPTNGHRIRQFSVAGGRIFVSRVHRFSTTIEIYGLDGTPQGEVPLREFSTATIAQFQPESDRLFFHSTSIDEPSTLYSFEPKTRELSVVGRPRIDHDRDLAIDEVEYASKDGTLIPLFLSRRRDLAGTRQLPTFLTGYGGFGIPVTSRFTAFSTFLLEQGFVIAVPALRGGSELGAKWHRSGKLDQRQNAFDDFIAAADWLVVNGLTAAGRIAIGGGSNAGLLVGAAITQRPALFRAAICLGPLLDMLRYDLFDRADKWIPEYGSPREEKDFRWLLAYSPYHRVRPQENYPAVMIISGDADVRCNPMHARKMAARLQSATTSGNPILLDYKPLWGHMPVQPRSTKVESLTDRLAFICHELGVHVRGVHPC